MSQAEIEEAKKKKEEEKKEKKMAEQLTRKKERDKMKEAVKKLGNKNIYTKVDNVMARKTPNVNNGILNNTWGLISAKNTLVGRVTAIAEDKNGAKNSDGRIYKWLKVNLSANAKKSINESEKESFLNRIGGALPTDLTIEAYVREDTITLI